MTATAQTAPTAAPAGPASPAVARDRSAARRTMLTLLASALGVMPLKALLSDNKWLIEAWLTMLVVIVPAALIRLRRAPGALDIWPGIILLVPLLTRMFVAQHAWGGFIPTSHTFTDVGNLMESLHRTTRDSVAPIHSTIAVRLVICALLGLLAALVDLIAVVGRRGALAGVPLLVVYTVSGAVPRTPVAWFWFAFAAAGYLILLGLDADDELRAWGRRISRPGSLRGGPGVAFSAQRIGIVAVVIAVILPFLVPDHPKNLIANAFHSGSGNGVGGFGAGSGGGSISPFAALKGQLERDRPTPLMNVHVDADGPVQPFYVRSNVLDRVTAAGWSASPGGHGSTTDVDSSSFGTDPPTGKPLTSSYRASITITGLTGNASVFAVPRSLQGLDSDSQWSSQDQLVLGSKVSRGDKFTEEVEQAEPSVAQLDAAPPATGNDVARWLSLPDEPKSVTDLVESITKNASTPYLKARAISNWFADPVNGFTYSLKTTKGDSGSDLVDFLQNRSGFCQQYAAAMGIMLRLAGVPTRVVLGYMHPPPDKGGNFSITTFDAHAWVEAFFPGAGWIPFDPTPTAGLTGGQKTDLQWAPHVFPSSANDVPNTRSSAPHRSTEPTESTSSAPAVAATSASNTGSASLLLWIGGVILVVLLLGLAPATVRGGRRRRRYAAARRGDPDALWAELSDTAVDLGYVWSSARTPRQVSAWLARDAASTAPSLDALAVAVERRRYAPDTGPRETESLARGLQDVTNHLRSQRSGRIRMQARFWPASLGWGRRLGSLTAVARRRR
jgi:transglutaminase-like putative cysteine protease